MAFAGPLAPSSLQHEVGAIDSTAIESWSTNGPASRVEEPAPAARFASTNNLAEDDMFSSQIVNNGVDMPHATQQPESTTDIPLDGTIDPRLLTKTNDDMNWT
ncbi:hypothetical protein AAL_04472 [Moelleriella libera RCEF 2490]|uniref:Uncharacterized protein n=1 Tax=Moelleriella libera RCEF 2490 TaxID=1081109 RepID=A0A168BFM6_9HYPO|nr:hypothetical protein AAL_04472 [Moelleriella libera RCEF 2490]